MAGSAGGLVGSDPDQLDELGRCLIQGAEAVDQIRCTVGGRLHTTSWCGRDADVARAEWDHRHVAAMLGAAAALRDRGRQLSAEAEQQRRASSVAGTPGATPPRRDFQHQDPLMGFLAGAAEIRDLLGDVNVIAGTLEFGHDVAHSLNLDQIGRSFDLLPGIRLAGKVVDGALSGVGAVLDIADIYEGVNTGDWSKVTFGTVGLGLAAASLIFTGPVGAVVVGGLGIGVAVVKEWPGVEEAVDQFWEGVGAQAPAVVNAVGEATEDVIEGAVDLVGGGVDAIGDGWQAAGDAVDSGARMFASWFGGQ